MRIIFIFLLVSFSFLARGQDLIFNSSNEELKTYVRQALDTLKGAPNANKFRWARNRLETGYFSSVPPRGDLREELDQLIIKVSDDWVQWSNQQRVEAINQRGIAEQKAQEADSAKAYAIVQRNEAIRQEGIAKVNGKKAEAGYLVQLSAYLSDNNFFTPALYTAFLGVQLSEGQTTPAVWRRLAEAYQDTLYQQIGEIPDMQEVRWLPDRKHFMGIKGDQFSLFFIQNEQIITVFEETGIESRSLHLDPSGNLIVWVKDQAVQIYQVKDRINKTLGSFTEENISNIAVSGDLKQVALASFDHKIYLFSTESAPSKTLSGHQGKVYQMKFLPDAKSLISRGADRMVNIWDLNSGGLVKSIAAHDYYTTDLGIASDGSSLVSSGIDGSVKSWSTDGQLIDASPAKEVPIQEVTFMGNKDYFMTLNGNKELEFYQLKGEQIIGLESPIKAINTLKQGEKTAPVLALGENGSVLLLSSTGSSKYTFPGHDAAVTHIDFNPEQTLNLSTDQDDKTLLWDLKGQVVLSLDLEHTQAFPPVFSSDYQGIYYFKPENQQLVFTPIPSGIYKKMKEDLSDEGKKIINKLIEDYQLSFVQKQE